MSVWLVIGVSFAYLILLFAVAYVVERKKAKGIDLINNPYIYALSMAVYCTAWTFYGSIGRAAEEGPDFLTIYLGPTIMAPLWWIILRKIIRISKVQRITTIADFISSRYGKSVTLGTVATVVCIIGVLPYISLQIKAIGTSVDFIVDAKNILAGSIAQKTSILSSTPFYVTIILGIFIIFFGTRKIDSSEKHEGMVATIAMESIIKLIAFLIAGVFITWFLFNGLQDIFAKGYAQPELRKLLVLNTSNGYAEWLSMIFLATFAVLFLPRQFQISVVENNNEKHINKAIWIFPLYLLIINLFVLPIVLAGKLSVGLSAQDAYLSMLYLPFSKGENLITMIIYIGGFSAATGMIIVETIALSIMLSNNLLMPLIVSIPFFREKFIKNISSTILIIRRVSIMIILLLAYGYYVNVAENYSLVSIGLISFAAVAQFAPSIIGGIFWKDATRYGALTGLIAGFIIWFYTLVVPTIIGAKILPNHILTDGLFGINLLKPEALFGLQGVGPLTNATFWSLLFNISLYAIVSLYTKKTKQEEAQAELFVNVYHYSNAYEKSVIYSGATSYNDIKKLLSSFLGDGQTKLLLQKFNNKYNLEEAEGDLADPKLVTYVEKILAGVIGSASSRILIEYLIKDEEITLTQVVDILKESQQLIILNKELQHKTTQLQKASRELESANLKLIELDLRKDDFLNTITHELRTPLTSIRAFTEIIFDNPDMDEAKRQHFLQTMIAEIERLSRLITQVLDLEKLESGKHEVDLSLNSSEIIISETINPFEQLIKSKNIKFTVNLQQKLPLIYVDKDLIIRVLANLISNAIKYCNLDAGEIIIEAYIENNKLKISVVDNGEGLEETYHEVIFNKFYQAKIKNRKVEGTGLGLALSKKIVDLHNGRIWVEHAENSGSNFIVELPINAEI